MEKLEEFLAFCAEREVSPVPVVYLVLEPAPPDAVARVRLAESEAYRAKGYECVDFHKPICRVLREVRRADG